MSQSITSDLRWHWMFIYCVGGCVWLPCGVSHVCPSSGNCPTSAPAQSLGGSEPWEACCMNGVDCMNGPLSSQRPQTFSWVWTAGEERGGEEKGQEMYSLPAWPASGSAWFLSLHPLVLLGRPLAPLTTPHSGPWGVSTALVGSPSPAHPSINSPFIKVSSTLPPSGGYLLPARTLAGTDTFGLSRL